MRSFVHDLRLGLRSLVGQPGFTFVTVATLALGIGANTAIFTFVNAAWLRPLPVADAERLVLFDRAASYPDLRDLREASQTLTGVVACGDVSVAMDDGRRTDRLTGKIVDPEYFTTLGVVPTVGRGLLPGDGRVLVLSAAVWRGRFGGDPAIAGRQLSLNGESFEVVGVAPPAFHGIRLGERPDFWVPMGTHAAITPGWNFMEQRREVWLSAFGRLAPGSTRAEAQAELATLAAALERSHGEAGGGEPDAAVTLSSIDASGSRLRSSLGPVLSVMMAVVGLVLLIACANLANLLLVRASGRRQEIAVRLALGAGRGSLIRLMLAESLLLSVAGGAAALLLAPWAVEAMARLIPATRGTSIDLPIDARVLVFTAVLCGATSLLFGLGPAIRASRQDLIPALHRRMPSVGPIRRTMGGALATVQVALAVTVVVGAGLFLRSLQHTAAIDPGFDPDRVVTFQVNPALNGYDAEAVRLFYAELTDRISALPGVESVSTSFLVQLGFGNVMRPVERGDRATAGDDESLVAYNVIGPGYFEALGMPLDVGREFAPTDRAQGPPVAIVNQALARMLWPGESPLGRTLRLPADQPGPAYEVVGIAPDSKVLSLTETPRPYLYLPMGQHPRARRAVLVRTEGDAAPAIDAMREVVRRLDAGLPIYNVRSYRDYLDDRLAEPVALATLVGAFGGLALSLAILGVYGVMAFVTRRRTREFGIRLALGARPTAVLRLVLLQGAAIVGVGLAAGLLLALTASGFVESLLYGVPAVDPLTFAVVTVAMVLAALPACLMPALRATRIAPDRVLREE